MSENTERFHRVLIVDDDPAVREVLSKMLQAAQRSVEICDSARAALEFVQHNPIDTAFVDGDLKGMTAAEFAGKVWDLHPQAHVVVGTVYLAAVDGRDARITHRDRAHHKPMNMGEVLRLANTCAKE
jgi:two-component SAPR family response regulator